MMFWYSNKFYSEIFKKIIVGAYGKKIVLSIYIFDVKLRQLTVSSFGKRVYSL